MPNVTIFRLVLVLALLGGPVPGLVHAQEQAARTAAAPAEAAPPAIALEQREHEIVVDGEPLAYTVTAGTLPYPPDKATPDAEIFHVAYVAKAMPAGERPVSFVVNGGPGAAAVYLHLGALGPWRLASGEDGRTPEPPPRLEQNPWTWLAFTDLVFIDPVGTGYSRAAASRGSDDRGERAFWSVDADLDSLVAFIRLWLDRNERWASPKYLVGESYGGFRAAVLADQLPARSELALNGVVLVSPALERDFLWGSGFDLLPWVLRIPSFAATAQAHGKAPSEPAAGVEAFALGDLLAGMARGTALPDAEADGLAERLSALIGLPVPLLEEQGLRISAGVFAQRLLEDRGQVVSLYDGSIADQALPGERRRGRDPELERLNAALSAAFAAYARSELGIVTDIPYRVLRSEVARRWEWGEDGGRAGDRLARALVRQPGLKVLVAHGLYDLVTPYLGSTYVLNQIRLDPAVRDNVKVATYPGGHMFYTRPTSLEAFHRDAAALYEGAPVR